MSRGEKAIYTALFAVILVATLGAIYWKSQPSGAAAPKLSLPGCRAPRAGEYLSLVVYVDPSTNQLTVHCPPPMPGNAPRRFG